MLKWLVRLGAAVTVVYLGFLAFMGFVRWEELSRLPLNELGDTMAGAFGPVAFLWLVLGYLQQGEELRLNTLELKRAVEHQGELAKIGKSQLDQMQKEYLDSMSPEFSIECQNRRSANVVNKWTLRITNVGATCTQLRVKSKHADLKASPSSFPDLQELAHCEVNIAWMPGTMPKELHFSVELRYKCRGRPGVKQRIPLQFIADHDSNLNLKLGHNALVDAGFEGESPP